MRTINVPEVDMLLVAKSSQKQRRSILNFAPKIGLSVVDYGRLDEIDSFYLDCQNYRDYYRDPYSKLAKPVAFKKHYGKCGQKNVERTTAHLLMPVTWVREKQPVICPLKYDRSLRLNDGIRIGGQHDPISCIKFKR